MSQAKPSSEALDLKTEEPSGRVQTRRSSRSANSGSPAMASKDLQDIDSMSPSSRSSSPETDARVTRSQSTESSTAATVSRKRRRRGRAPGPNKKRTDTPNSSSGRSNAATRGEEERETRNTTQRMTKEAREARKAERDGIIKQRLSELDQLEKAVKDGNHPEYHQLLQDIEAKRRKRLVELKVWQSSKETNIRNTLECDKKIAFDQFHLEKLALRRSMMQEVQQKINTLEQEYNALNATSSLDNEHLPEWMPPDRPTMISSLTPGLSDEDILHDLERARKETTEYDNDEEEDGPAADAVATLTTDNSVSYYHSTKSKSPPIDKLATLADHQYSPKYAPSGNTQEEQDQVIYPPLGNSWREGASLPI